MRKERRVCRRDDDDRSHFARLLVSRWCEFAANRNSRYDELVCASAVELHQHPEGVSTSLARKFSRRRTDATFPSVADHSGAAADVAFGYRSRSRAVERGPRVLALHVKTVDVVQKAVVGFCYHRQ